ncbi:MAG: GntR family transcriptional regulator [Syntrophomonadaceae bacterium]
MQFNSSQPIYRQIIDSYKKKLVRGELKTGDKILSQREYAANVRVNPNTVQRAYREMENMQMVETVRGQGTFVTATGELIAQIKQEMARKVIDYFVGEMSSLGYTRQQMVEMLLQESDYKGGQEK